MKIDVFNGAGLDYYSQTPLYQQLISLIRRSIDSGVLKEGDMLPAEMDLCESYSISRSTVRQAFAALEKEGIITRYRGKGTFVTSPKVIRSLQNLGSFSSEMRSAGLQPSTKLLTFEVIKVSGDIAFKMQLNDGEEVYKIMRLRSANDEPMVIETDFLPKKLCPNLTIEDIETRPLFGMLEEDYGLCATNAIETYDVTTIDANEAELLNTRTGSSAFFVQRITRDEKGIVFKMAIMLVRGDRCRYEIELNGEDISYPKRTIKGVINGVAADKN